MGDLEAMFYQVQVPDDNPRGFGILLVGKH